MLDNGRVLTAVHTNNKDVAGSCGRRARIVDDVLPVRRKFRPCNLRAASGLEQLDRAILDGKRRNAKPTGRPDGDLLTKALGVSATNQQRPRPAAVLREVRRVSPDVETQVQIASLTPCR
jgi:hypothetical protein